MSIKLHFQGTYDIVKQKWRFVNPMEDTFYGSSSYGLFKALANYKIDTMREWTTICIVMFRDNPAIGYDQLLDEYEHWKSEARKWEGHITNMPHVFENEGKKIITQMYDEDMTFDGRFGLWVMNKLLARKMCVETFIVFQKLLKFGLDGNPKYEYLYKDKYQRYAMLININPERYREVLSNLINNEKQRRCIM